MTPSDVTLIENAIHNPNEPRHFMEVVPASGERTATIGGVVIARSTGALVVKEIGRHVYDPVVYFPRDDVAMDRLAGLEKSTHCPLKGDTEYFDVVVDDARVTEAAWSYVDTIEAAAILRGLVAFDAAQVDVD
ncbi:MAG: DUF427 domain-containing protein [Actinomycetota bacterium]